MQICITKKITAHTPRLECIYTLEELFEYARTWAKPVSNDPDSKVICVCGHCRHHFLGDMWSIYLKQQVTCPRCNWTERAAPIPDSRLNIISRGMLFGAIWRN